MLYEGKISTTLKVLASRHCGSCSSPNVNTMCLEFVCVFRHCFEKFLSRSSDFSSSQNNTCTFQFDLERTSTFKQQ